jgi:hypothetical protein
MRKHPRIKSVLRKVGEVLLRGSVAGLVRWLLDQWLGI